MIVNTEFECLLILNLVQAFIKQTMKILTDFKNIYIRKGPFNTFSFIDDYLMRDNDNLNLYQNLFITLSFRFLC